MGAGGQGENRWGGLGRRCSWVRPSLSPVCSFVFWSRRPDPIAAGGNRPVFCHPIDMVLFCLRVYLRIHPFFLLGCFIAKKREREMASPTAQRLVGSGRSRQEPNRARAPTKKLSLGISRFGVIAKKCRFTKNRASSLFCCSKSIRGRGGVCVFGAASAPASVRLGNLFFPFSIVWRFSSNAGQRLAKWLKNPESILER